MPLTKEQKSVLLKEIADKLKNKPTVYLTDYMGMTVAQSTQLRTKLREAGLDFMVVKNTLLRLAMQQLGGYEEVFDHLNGPTAVIFSQEPSTPARVLKKYLQDAKAELPRLKGASVEGAAYHGDVLEVLATLKSKEDLLGEVIALLLSPMANVVGALQAPGGTLAGAVQTLAEREG